MEFLLALYAGIIVACLMEIWKKGYRKVHKGLGKEEDVIIPTSIALLIGAVISCTVASVLWAWKLRPNENVWAILFYGMGIFCFQYFVSMEIIKNIVKAITKRETGIEID